MAKVLGETEDTWAAIFQNDLNRRYAPPKLVLFRGATPTACGTGQSAMGPFYCPGDSKVYIDLAFFDELKNRFKAPGDFAQAYVIAHEVGHHVQHLLGISDQVDNLRRRNPSQANALSVRMELQADCFAGLWAQRANAARQILESGDVEKRWPPPPPSATTGCRSRARAMSSPTRSPTAPRNSACAGSSAAWKAAASSSAIPSRPASCRPADAALTLYGYTA